MLIINSYNRNNTNVILNINSHVGYESNGDSLGFGNISWKRSVKGCKRKILKINTN